ncbi:MAG TPA: DUF4268 domain-containing protein [Acidimicrobiales bacterium]|nr:DUF4268 domain-containing protein [Acidimicrobiales bacterium]
MAEEMLFTVAGSVAMPAQMISLEEAGLEERADLQEWVLSNPAILGPAVKVITFEFDGVPTASGAGRDRIWVLGLGADGRLVVAELKSSRTPDTDVSAVKYAAMASRILPESLADQYARFQSRRQSPVTLDEALAELQAHAPDLTQESLRRPRIVLLARDFSPLVTASVVWLSEMGLDISLVQISAFRSYVYGHAGSGNVPMISVSQLYPLREVEEFTISPERQLAKEMADSKRRVQDASTVRRLVTSESVADGTIFTIAPRDDMNFELRSQLEEWLHADPARRTAHWQNVASAALVWDADKAPYTPAGLVRHIVELATGISRDFSGTQWWRDPGGWTLAELAGPLSGGKGALYREFWSRWLDRVRIVHSHWTQMSTLPAQNFITLPSPIMGTHYGLGFAAGGRLRSDFFIDLGSPGSTAQFEVIQAQREVVESIYDAPLSWERLPDRAAFRIADYSEGEITTVEDYAFYIDWMIDSQERLRRAIEGVLQGGAPQSEDFDRR